MRVFDLHCDTLTKCLCHSSTLRGAQGHVSLERGAAYDEWAQLFAAFVPDLLQGRAAADYCDIVIGTYHAQMEDITRVCKPILAIENGNALMGNLQRLDVLAEDGVKALTLVWNGENELGFGAQCDPQGRLKPFGRQAVARMFELGIQPDLSHMNEAGFWDVAQISDEAGRPLLATHSNCYAIEPHKRNLKDDQLKALFADGGLIGLNLYTLFLGGEGSAEDIARHLAHMIDLGGEDCVAMGSDYDGCDIHPTMDRLDKLPYLDDRLDRLGFTQELREKLFWGNAARFFGV